MTFARTTLRENGFELALWIDIAGVGRCTISSDVVNNDSTTGYWNAIVGDGGQESQGGWCKDRWGLSWQITPRVLTDALAAGGDEAKRAFEAMMTMTKIDVATIEAARRGEWKFAGKV